VRTDSNGDFLWSMALVSTETGIIERKESIRIRSPYGGPPRDWGFGWNAGREELQRLTGAPHAERDCELRCLGALSVAVPEERLVGWPLEVPCANDNGATARPNGSAGR
jgi:hypothetical protein